MHLPSESLHGAICPVTAIMAIVGVSVAAFLLSKGHHRPSRREFILTTVAVLALQAVNYPLPGGFSGHMLGAALAVSLLGLPAGILSMTSVITLQCLLFADGYHCQRGNGPATSRVDTERLALQHNKNCSGYGSFDERNGQMIKNQWLYQQRSLVSIVQQQFDSNSHDSHKN